MTLRHGPGADVRRTYEQIDDLLDGAHAVIIRADLKSCDPLRC